MNTQVSFFILLICLIISCNKMETPTPSKPEREAFVRFTDFTTGLPIKNIKVIILEEGIGGSSIEDSVYTDTYGSIQFEKKSTFDYHVIAYTPDYFQEKGQAVLQNNTEIILFPRKEITVHFKQVTAYKAPLKIDSLYCLLPVVEGYRLTSTNSLIPAGIHPLLETEMNPWFAQSRSISLFLKDNQLIDTTIRGFIHKNLYNSIQYNFAEYWENDGGYYDIGQSTKTSMIKPGSSSADTILIEF